jgi:uncharacterized protein (TIGR01244 family)
VKTIFFSISALLLVLAAGLVVTGQQADKPPVPGVTNFSRVDATVACGGATTTEAFPALKAEGFKSVINLRQAEEPGANIEQARAAATAAGLAYIHVPMNGHEPKAEAVDAFLAAVKDPANSPVYIHCASANRVGAVWLVKRVLVDGWDVARATAEAERIGLKSPVLKQFALDYLKAHAG